MPKFSDYINAKTIAAYVTTAGSNKIPYLGATLFPASKKLGLDLKWIKTHAGLPVSLAIGAFDAKSVIRSRSGFTLTKTEMPFSVKPCLFVKRIVKSFCALLKWVTSTLNLFLRISIT
ncbi:MAG: hypothetical protein RSD70_06940, partial [Acidaminococcaceae bacterium]